MNANLFLEDILELLSAYGRPTVNQFSVSATPGYRAAGTWNVEVAISPHGLGECATPELNALQKKEHAWVGARCIGRSSNLTDAARQCLRECEELMEGPKGGLYKLVSAEDCVRTEKLARTDEEMALHAQHRAALDAPT